MSNCPSIHLEKGYNTTDEVIERLQLELTTLERLGVKAVKIVHSSELNANFEIKKEIRLFLSKLYFDGKLKAVCYGEKFGPFEADGKKVARLFTPFRKDPDWSRRNPHITLAIIK